MAEQKGKKIVAVIGAGSEAIHAIEKAKELDLYVIAYDGDFMAAGLAAADEGHVLDIAKEDLVIEVLQKNKPDFLLSVPIGRYLTTIGAVNDSLLLKGVSKTAAVLCTDKYAFHQLIKKTGFREATCVLLSGHVAEDIMSLQVPYPAILKPRYGSGSKGIYYLTCEKEYTEALTQITKKRDGKVYIFEQDYLLEEAIEGEEYGVDGAVVGDACSLILLRRKLLTPLPERQAVGYFSVVPEEEPALCGQIAECLKAVTKSMGLSDCLFHADIIKKDQRLFVIELSARPSGHNLHNLFTPLATGIDPAWEYSRMQAGYSYRFTPKSTKKMLIHYFDFEDKQIIEVPRPLEFTLTKGVSLIDWQCHIKAGEYMEKVPNGPSLMGRGYFILEGRTEQDLEEMAQQILGVFLGHRWG